MSCSRTQHGDVRGDRTIFTWSTTTLSHRYQPLILPFFIYLDETLLILTNQILCIYGHNDKSVKYCPLIKA